MRKFLATIAAASLFVVPTHGAPREPTGKWVVDFGEDQCVAVLPFGSEDDPEMLVIKPIPSGNHVQIGMVVDGRKRNASVVTGEVRINGTTRNAQLLSYGTSTKKRVYRFLVPGTIDSIGAMERLAMDLPDETLDLVIPQMAQVSSNLAECMRGLRLYWNIDGDGVAASAQGDVREVFSYRDYPSQAFDERESGIARAFLLIDEEGKVADCTLSAFAGNVILATQTCAILRERVEMEPARNAEGEAVRHYYVTPRIHWQMENSRKDMREYTAEMDRLEDVDGNCIEFEGTC